VFQSYHLLDHLTVYENLEVRCLPRRQEVRARQHGLRRPRSFQHRRQERTCIPTSCPAAAAAGRVARAVIANPKVVLADEPTGNLHSSQGREIMELFKRLNEGGTTIIQVTHSEANAAYGRA
jgi:ABC-type lipoprotein export system ATPase subunit